jgi:hypothetical protein
MDRRRRIGWKGTVLAAMLALGLPLATGASADGKLWFAGPYSFSDERGGFVITGLGGSGTRDDPYLIRQELFSSSPVTLVIRVTAPLNMFDPSGRFAIGQLHMRIETVNASGQAWQEFEFELQEAEGQPSTFGDGLSFDQRRQQSDTISSDSFGWWSRAYEPYDRLRFREGHVDPQATAGFGFFINDFTPRAEFYLVQDPRIPFS